MTLGTVGKNTPVAGRGSKPQSSSERSRCFVDLFCGAGGFTWGWARAGFRPLAAIDNDASALRTHEANFGGMECKTLHGDLAGNNGKNLAKFLNISPRKISIIVGGPPCQGWSKVGRGKLRSLGATSDDLLHDPRNRLYRNFIEAVSQCRPKICVMENVPGMLSIRGINVAEMVKGHFEEIGYACTYALVNACWFGVPQNRKRLIFLCTHRDMRKMDAEQLEAFAHEFRCKTLGITRQTTVSDAIRDLPEIANGSKQDPVTYMRARGRLPSYLEIMRGHANGIITDHVCRKQNAQDVEAFTTMEEGMQYYQLESRFKRYRDDIFRDKYKKLAWDSPSGTVTAHLAKDCYTHIHPGQPRTISVREAARLQSFPDDFRFWGNMGERFRQIGNAVPPLMAWGIAEFVRRYLEKDKQP